MSTAFNINDIIVGSDTTINSSTINLLVYDTASANLGTILEGAVFCISATIVGYDGSNDKGVGQKITGFFRVSSGIPVQISTTSNDTVLKSDVAGTPIISFIITSTKVVVQVIGGEGATVAWSGTGHVTTFKP